MRVSELTGLDAEPVPPACTTGESRSYRLEATPSRRRLDVASAPRSRKSEHLAGARVGDGSSSRLFVAPVAAP